jgi:ribosomal protein L44E
MNLPANVTSVDDYIRRKADELVDTPRRYFRQQENLSAQQNALDEADDFAKKTFPRSKINSREIS